MAREWRFDRANIVCVLKLRSIGTASWVLCCLALVSCAVDVAGPGSEDPSLPRVGSRAEAARICAMDKTVAGIDVSYWQGPDIDWDRVATTDNKYVFIRASYGTTLVDKYFARNWKEAERVGLLRGAYHFFLPGRDPIVQADLFLKTMGPLKPGDLPPVLDVEDADGVGPAAFATAIRKWVNRVREVTGVMPIIYTRYYFWREQLADSDEWADAPLWTAHYTKECPLSPDPWSSWDFWQYSDTGRTAGISGNVDQNIFNGSLAKLKELTVGAQECPSVPAEGRIIDNDDPCFLPTGPIEYWRSVSEGYDGSLLWTNTTDKAQTVNGCEWTLNFEQAGRYTVAAHTSKPWSQATNAKYRIETADGAKNSVVDQSAVQGWNPLGVYAFEANKPYRISVGDNTGTPTSEEVKLTCDALQVEPDQGLDTMTPGSETPPVTEPPTEEPTTPPVDRDPGADPNQPPPTYYGGELTGGCQLRSAEGAERWSALVPVVGLLLVARRRRRRNG